MSKIGYKELSLTLVEKYGLERDAAEQFVEKMFDVLVKGIETDRQVKVKGLGTFKVVAVAPRKSVDVNTGEAIVIDGRDKVSFTPDSAMRELVNRPFSQFETVAVNDGVDFADIDERYAGNGTADNNEYMPEEPDGPAPEPLDTTSEPTGNDAPVAEDVAPEPVEAAPKAAEVAPEPVEAVPEPELTEEPEPQNEITETKETTIMEPETPTTGNVPVEPKENALTDGTQPDTTPSTTPPEPEPEKRESEEVLPVPEAERMVDDARNQVIIMQQEMARQHRFMRWFMCTCVVLLLVCTGGLFYLGTQISQRDHRIEHLEAEAILASRTPQGQSIIDAAVDSAAIIKAQQDSLEAARQLQQAETARKKAAEAEKAKAEQAMREAAQKANEKAEKEKAEAAAQKTKTTATPATAPTNYNKDVRIRTGAYDIVGIDRTVTVKAGQTLESISRTHLGPGMECYLEAVNATQAKLKVGDKVNIPKLKLKKKK